jgi:hypothetical protein
MSFNWEDYLTLASQLANNPPPHLLEAHLRAAVSRAYFAAFCKSRNLARDNTRKTIILNNDDTDHGKVIEYYSSGKKANIGDYLRELRKYRNSCDYDDNIYNLSRIAQDALSLSQKVITLLITP